MPDVTQPTERVRFGPFAANFVTGELCKHGIRLRLQDQPFQVLAMLLSSPGELVTREEIQKKLWPSGTFVDFENGLNSAVNRLREALGDSASEPRMIETVPRRGYRFIAPILPELLRDGKAKAPLEEREEQRPSPGDTRFPWNSKLALIGASLAVIFVAITAAWRPGRGSPTVSAVARKLVPVPLVTYADGGQWLPAFSPDGSRIAYSWQTGDGWYLEVKLLGSDTRLRLTKQAAKFPPGPAWSPDGRQIAYARADASDERGIFVTSAMGGAERKLRSLARWRVPQRIVSWSPDGRWIAFADETPVSMDAMSKERGPNVLYLISPETLETRQLTTAVGKDFGDSAPTFSPDGATIAFVHTNAEAHDEICTIPVGGGTPQKLVTRGLWTNGLAWTADSRSIVFDRSLQGGFDLWKVELNGGEARPLDIPTRGNMLEPSLWRDRLAYESHETVETVGRIRLNRLRSELPQTPVASTRYDHAGRYSPHGDRIAFLSNRTGMDELWLADGDGANSTQLTHLGIPLVDVAWDPSGKFVAFSSTSGKVHLISVETGSSQVVFDGLAFTDENVPNLAFSRDGKYVYVLIEPGTGNKYSLMKAPVSGEPATKVMDGILTNFAESSDGRTLFYSRAEGMANGQGFGIWKRPVDGGEEEFVMPVSGIWDVGADGLYVVTNHSTIERRSFSGKHLETVARLGSFGARFPMSVSPDGQSALFGYRQHESIEIDMVDGVK